MYISSSQSGGKSSNRPAPNMVSPDQKEDRPELLRGRSSSARRGTCKHMNPASDRNTVTSKPWFNT